MVLEGVFFQGLAMERPCVASIFWHVPLGTARRQRCYLAVRIDLFPMCRTQPNRLLSNLNVMHGFVHILATIVIVCKHHTGVDVGVHEECEPLETCSFELTRIRAHSN